MELTATVPVCGVEHFLSVFGPKANGQAILIHVDARDMFQDELAISNLRGA